MMGQSVRDLETTQEIKVLPTTVENAPLSITKQNKMYYMSNSKALMETIIPAKRAPSQCLQLCRLLSSYRITPESPTYKFVEMNNVNQRVGQKSRREGGHAGTGRSRSYRPWSSRSDHFPVLKLRVANLAISLHIIFIEPRCAQ